MSCRGQSHRLSAAGQKSTVSLLSSEEFRVGGSRFGRAFDPSEISGEDGVAGSLELRYDFAPGVGFPKALRFYGFVDNGATDDSQAGRQSIGSVGGGIRATPIGGFRAAVEVAHPV